MVGFLARSWPTEHTLRVVLGDAAPRVTEVRLRYDAASESGAGGRRGGARAVEPEREVSFRYAKGRAPRIVSHEPRLASGDYDVDIEVEIARQADRSESPSAVVAVTRRLSLREGAVSVDVTRDLEGAP